MRVAGIERGVANAEAGMHHLILSAGRNAALLGAALETHHHRHLCAQRTAVELERFFATAIKVQVSLDLHCGSPVWGFGLGVLDSLNSARHPGRFGISTIGRTSTVPHRAAGMRAAMLRAASKSFASTRKYPPSCSRVSAKGPSVTRRLPSRTRTLVAVATGCSGDAPRYCPLAWSSCVSCVDST